MTDAEEPILSRIDRLDKILKHLEEIRSSSNRSPRISYTSSTPSTTGTLTSDGHGGSSTEFSPKSLEKHCRPINEVILETELKGTLIERLVHVEHRVLKLCLQLEGEIMEGEKTEEMASTATEKNAKKKKKKKKGGLKQLVKSCVKGKSSSTGNKHNNKSKSHVY